MKQRCTYALGRYAAANSHIAELTARVLQHGVNYGMWTILTLFLILIASVRNHRDADAYCVALLLSPYGMHTHSLLRGIESPALTWQVLIYSCNLRNRWRFRHIPGPIPAWLGGNLHQVS